MSNTDAESIITLVPKSSKGFVETPLIKDITDRAVTYIRAGFPIHFRGASGTGKTTLALRIAELLRRPVVMIHGDEEYTTTSLVGGETGFYSKKVRDNFIHSVLKIEEQGRKEWIDNRLTVAVKEGLTLIYDEYTRSRPEANNILLSVLQEGILDLPTSSDDGRNCLKVHPNFAAIFTSNPEEYAGVHRSQDALRDRMITIDLEHFDRETEIAITAKKSGLNQDDAARIVDVVRNLRDSREYEFAPTVRGCVMVAKSIIVHKGKITVDAKNKLFRQMCIDIIASETSRIGSPSAVNRVRKIIDESIDRHCARRAVRPAANTSEEVEKSMAVAAEAAS